MSWETALAGAGVSLWVVALACPSVAALTLETIAIDNYAGNGSPSSDNLSYRIADVRHVGYDSTYGWFTWLYDDEDSAAQSWLFTGTSPGISGDDIVYYSGHGDPDGPYLGDGSAYQGMYPSNYYWGEANVRWVISDSCLNLYDGNQGNVGPNWYSGSYPISRWFQAVGWGSGSLHSFLGHRSDGWDVEYTGADFIGNAWNCAGCGSEGVGDAWMNASYDNEYWLNGWFGVWHTQGVEPAVLSAYAGGQDYYYDHLTSPLPNPSAQSTNGSVTYHWGYSGTPKFF